MTLLRHPNEDGVSLCTTPAALARLREALGTHQSVLLDRAGRDSLARRALVSALTQHGYLVIRRGRIRPVNRCRKRSGIP